jgi:hypothetical protein
VPTLKSANSPASYVSVTLRYLKSNRISTYLGSTSGVNTGGTRSDSRSSSAPSEGLATCLHKRSFDSLDLRRLRRGEETEAFLWLLVACLRWQQEIQQLGSGVASGRGLSPCHQRLRARHQAGQGPDGSGVVWHNFFLFFVAIVLPLLPLFLLPLLVLLVLLARRQRRRFVTRGRLSPGTTTTRNGGDEKASPAWRSSTK